MSLTLNADRSQAYLPKDMLLYIAHLAHLSWCNDRRLLTCKIKFHSLKAIHLFFKVIRCNNGHRSVTKEWMNYIGCYGIELMGC
jgi:hypothetical protein